MINYKIIKSFINNEIKDANHSFVINNNLLHLLLYNIDRNL